ncbi:MAG: histidine phosphatase family protein [Gammaproteobacteria bacterium]|nr:histidine phosphatase family protein [Gammaproteobacteria bacterium]
MIDVAMLRHGVTAWNEEGRIQGRTDVPLSERGRRALTGRRLPARFAAYRVHSSPLARAVETATLLGLGRPVLDRRLMEMNWGAWEGRTRASVAATDARGVARNEARGPDFRPPGGESPREMQSRITDWARSAARLQSDVVAITHKGVIKATLGLACAWDLVSKSPVRLDWSRVHHFRFDPESGDFVLVEPNLRLERTE